MPGNRFRSPARILRSEDGNIPASVVYVIFTTLFLSIIVTSLLASMGAATKTRNDVEATRAVSAVAGAYLDRAAAGDVPADGQLCTGTICADVTAGTNAAGARTVTVKAAAGESTRTRTLDIPAQQGTMITGFDDGRPVWGQRPVEGAAPEPSETDKQENP